MSDQIARRRNDCRCAPVILFEGHNFGIRIHFLKREHDFRLRTAETIDRLVIVPHNKQIIHRLRHQAHNIVLDLVDILKFIHEDIRIALLPRRKNIFSLCEQFVGISKHVVKIDQSIL